MKLYSYWRSTTSYRVRIALNLKEIDYETVPVNLVAGDQRGVSFASINPSQGVPALELADGTVLTQSLAILDYLDTVADPKLTPDEPILAAKVRAAAHVIALDIHPVNNLKVVGKLEKDHGADKVAWMRHWMTEGLTAFQALIQPDSRFCFGGDVTLADVCLTAQLVNAHRWGLDLTPFQRLINIENACLALPAFQNAAPEAQPDAT